MNDPDPRPTPAARHLEAAKANADDESALALRSALQAELSGYDVGARLGRGGMGVVFRAYQEKLDREVAIKVLTAPEDADEEERAAWTARFLREARALARLSHPGIVTIHDFGESGGLAWIVMELVDGSDLRSLLDEGALGPEEALAIAPQICAALQYAHDRGIVHRDVKPGNVLLTEEGTVKLCDFGLAKLQESDGGVLLTRTDQAMGTLRYMAPEQLDAPKEVDHRADIFSLGVVLYEMLTGRIPQGVFEPPSSGSAAPAAMDEVVLKALEREPERRYQKAADMSRSIEGVGEEAEAPPLPAKGKDKAKAKAKKRSAEAAEKELKDRRRTERRLGRLFDTLLPLLGLFVLGPVNSMTIVEWTPARGASGPFGLMALIALGAPMLVGLVWKTAPMPMLRAAFGVGNLVIALGLWAIASANELASGADHSAGAVYFFACFTLLSLLQLLAAALSRITEGPPSLGPWFRRGAHNVYLVLTVAVFITGVTPWSGAEHPAVQFLFLALLLAYGADLVWKSKQRTETHVAKGRAVAACFIGMMCFMLIAYAEAERYLYIGQARLPQFLALGLVILGGIEGAYTPLPRTKSSS